ncbi:caspase family protein [Actinoplanes sp. URMC 104]|uniref:caspase family protein n=1 Tax=Actinoplanes sp. URMC 104 TaxID=3423409 RepID=UPI003F1B7983
MRARALLIACSSYDNEGLPSLSSPPLDARLLAGVLTTPGLGLFAENDVEVLRDPTSALLRAKVSELLHSAANGDVVLIYYSGHGETYTDSVHRLFLTTRDSDLGRLANTSVDTGFINTVVAGMAKTVHVVLLVDACSAGAHQVDLELTSQLYMIGAAAAARSAPDGTSDEASPFATAVARTLLGLETPGDRPITADDVYGSLLRITDRAPFRSATANDAVPLTGPREGVRCSEEDFRREVQFARLPDTRQAHRELAQLTVEAREACRDMQVVPEDSPISERWVTAWWGSPSGHGLSDPEGLLNELIKRRLVEVTTPARQGHGRLVALRKPARAILSVGFTNERRRHAYDSMIRTTREMLLPADQPEAWWRLPAEPETLWGQMPRHLENAGRSAEADRLRCDPRWLALRIDRTGSVAESLGELEAITHRTPAAGPLRQHLLRARHLLDEVARTAALGPVLLGRIPGCEPLAADLTGARITAGWPLPDTPHPAQLLLLRPHYEHTTVPLATTPATRWLVTVGTEGVERWDPVTGERLPAPGHPVDRVPQCCAVTHDGQFVAIGDERGVRLLALSSGEVVATNTIPEVGRVLDCVAEPSRLLIVGSDNIARLLTLTDQGTVSSQDHGSTVELLGHSEMVTCCAMQAGLLATGSDDRTVRLWTRTGDSRGEPLQADGSVLCCALMAGGERIIGGTDGGSVLEWTTEGSAPQHLYRHAGAVRCVVADPHGRWVASGGEDGAVRVASATAGLAGGYDEVATLSGHRGAVTACVAAADGSWLATAGEDGTIRVWDPAVRATRQAPLRTEPAKFCVPSADGQWFIAGGGPSRALYRWNRNSPDAPEEVWGSRITAAAISTDDRLLAAGSSDGLVRLFTEAGLVQSFALANTPITACLVAADGSWLAAGLLTGETVVRSLVDEAGPSRRYVVDHSPIRGLAETPTGRLAVFSRRGTRALVDPADPAAEMTRDSQREQIHTAHITGAGTFVLTRTSGTVVSGSLTTLPITQPLRTEIAGGPPHFLTAAADRRGARLVTADAGRFVRIWTADGQHLAGFPLDQPVADCRWLDDSTVIAAGEAGVYLLTFDES